MRGDANLRASGHCCDLPGPGEDYAALPDPGDGAPPGTRTSGRSQVSLADSPAEPPAPARATPLAAFDATAARRWVLMAREALGRERVGIDALNVYPVPDGDTGTNLHLTLDAGARAVVALPSTAGLRTVLRALADGSLRGARGSSGAILAQFLRGLQPPAGRPVPGVAEGTALAHALARAAASARDAVPRPVEGTMLSVAAAAASAALAAGADLAATARASAEAARAALARTTGQLTVLRDAGVVDAGGRGLTVLFDALSAVVTGEAPPPAEISPPPLRRREPAPDCGAAIPAMSPGVEVTYLLLGGAEHAPALAAVLDDLGEDVVVGRGDGLLSVHVHLLPEDVDAAVRAGRDRGQVLDVRVMPLVPMGAGEARPASPTVVVLAAGEGLARLASGAGAVAVRTPAALADLLADPPLAGLLVLPTGAAGLAAALEARARVAPGERARVAVVACDTAPAALAALAVHDPGLGLAAAAARLDAAVGQVRPGRVVRDAAGLARGSALGVPVTEGADPLAVAAEVAGRVAGETAELLTIVAGAGQADLARRLADLLARTRPGLEVAVHPGDQPDELIALGAE